MELTYTVYKHTSPSGKVYIGITCQGIAKRWICNGIGYKGCSYFWNAIKKYGWDNIMHEVLAEGLTEAEAKQREKDLIIAYKTRDPLHGYNMTDGGDGMCGWIPSVETRALMSAAQMGRIHSEETKKKISAAAKGIPKTAEHRAAMSAGMKGIPRTIETKQKMSAARKGIPRTAETKQKMSAAQMGNHKALGCKRTAETRAAMGAAKKGKQYKLGSKCTAETKQKMRNAQARRAKEIECLTMDGEVIARYASLMDATEKTGIGRPHICQVCLGQRQTAGKLRWRYV